MQNYRVVSLVEGGRLRGGKRREAVETEFLNRTELLLNLS